MLVIKLNSSEFREPALVNKHENVFVESKLDNDNNVSKTKSTSQGIKHKGSVSTPLRWKHIKYLKEGLS